MTEETSLPKGITLEELAKRLKAGLDLEQLLGHTPVLVFRRAEGSESPLYATPADEVEVPAHAGGDTSVFKWGDGGPPPVTGLNTAVVVPLTPSNRNLLEDQVLLGRAVSNDIRLVSPQVSKVHVHFVLDDDEWRIVDQGSSNGTMLNGLRLEADNPYRLRPSDEIAFGDVVVLYLDAEGLRDMCSLVGGGG